MPTVEDILFVLRTINDPEMPISIVELGMVEHVAVTPTASGGSCVGIRLLPTFIGCPAIPMIEQEVRQKVGRLSGVDRVDVEFAFAPPWSVDRISEAGRASLAEHGVTMPAPAAAPAMMESVLCPFCGQAKTHVESAFGPTRCRMIYYCESCRNTFEHLKRV